MTPDDRAIVRDFARRGMIGAGVAAVLLIVAVVGFAIGDHLANLARTDPGIIVAEAILVAALVALALYGHHQKDQHP